VKLGKSLRPEGRTSWHLTPGGKRRRRERMAFHHLLDEVPPAVGGLYGFGFSAVPCRAGESPTCLAVMSTACLAVSPVAIGPELSSVTA
jgi:hypothetical protein